MNTDPRETILNSPMGRLQILVVALTIGLNALDGFDVMSISFASPGIAEEWGIDRAALGIVLSMELIGMAIGSILLGGIADKFGRRRTILGCLAVMTIGMFMVTTVEGLVGLSIWRVITGLGIGGMLAAINAVAAEFSNRKRKHMSVSLMAIGYPLGAVIGGVFVVPLLENYDWRSVFYFGTAVTVLFLPLVYFFVPESVHWLARKQPVGALEGINRTLRRMGHATITALPTIPDDTPPRRSAGKTSRWGSVKSGPLHAWGWVRSRPLFAPGLVGLTLIVTAAYFFHITTFYFIIKWVPKIVADMGFTAAEAAYVLTWVNAGGATGGAVFGLLTMRFGLKPLTIVVLALSTVMVVVFGRTPEEIGRLTMICFAAGFCTNAGIVGLYAIFAHAFPTHARASGTGFAIGLGRGGSVLAPIVSGFLFEGGISLQTVALIMGMGSVIAAVLLLMLKLKPDDPIADTSERERERSPGMEGSPAAS